MMAVIVLGGYPEAGLGQDEGGDHPGSPFVAITPSKMNTGFGGAATFVANISVDGDTAFYQWFKDGAPLIGENESVLSLSSLVVSDSGRYMVNVVAGQRTELSTPTVLTVRGYDATGDNRLRFAKLGTGLEIVFQTQTDHSYLLGV